VAYHYCEKSSLEEADSRRIKKERDVAPVRLAGEKNCGKGKSSMLSFGQGGKKAATVWKKKKGKGERGNSRLRGRGHGRAGVS